MPTAAEIQAAAAAAAQYTQTAEQAAMLNAAYRANELPRLPTYGAGSGITREQYEDAQNEAIKRQIAFSQPRSDVRQLSGEALAISQQYAASRNRVVTGGGVSYQGPSAPQNPYGANNAAAIAWEVGRTGGATDYQMNVIAEREVVAAGGDPGFIRYATDIYMERPQFEREILTTREGQQFENKEWRGVPIRLNLTKAEMAAGGGITPDNYGKFLRYDTSTYQLNRLSEPTTQFGIDTGVHKARGDFGGPWLKDGAYGGWRSGGGRIVGSKTVASFGNMSGVAQESQANPNKSVRVETQKGELPFFGEVPWASPLISQFMPKREITTTTKETQIAPTYETKDPYTIGDTTYFETVTTSGVLTEKTESTRELKTPFAEMVGGFLPETKKAEQPKGEYLLDILASPVREFTKSDFGKAVTVGALGPSAYSKITSPTLGKDVYSVVEGPAYFARGAIPMTPEWSKDTYENIREDPMRGVMSAGISVAIVGVGTGAKVFGAGTKFMVPTSTAGRVYQYASTVGSAGMVWMYGSDVLTRVTGSSIPQWVPMGQTKEQMGGGYFEGIQKRFPGWEQSRKQLNVVETQELIPMAVAFKASQYVGDKVVGWARTKPVPEIKNSRASGYGSKEGFPTNQNIKTQDLIDSFNTGVITSPRLAETTMAPTGEPLTRIPVGSQIGAPKGKAFIYTGAEYPFLQQGYVGESASELPALFAAPQRISYFTKAGQSQMGGFGITSDIFGIYRQPAVYRSVVKAGVYQEIPADILKIRSEGSANDPLNPRNVAIGEWMRTKAKPGVPVITQYGKAEWQYLIPSGSGVKEAKMTGWYRDAGQRIPQYDVTYTGKRSPNYKPPSPVTSPVDITYAEGGKVLRYTPKGVPLREVGRSPMGFSSTSVSSPSQRNVPVSVSSIARSGVSDITRKYTSPSISSRISSVTTPRSYPKSSYGFSSLSSTSFGSSSKVSSKSSSITSPIRSSYPSSSKTPSSTTYPSSSKYPSSSRSTSSSITTPKLTTTPFTSTSSKTTTSTTTTPSITTTETPFTEITTTRVPGGGGFGGGGGSRQYGNLGVTQWRRENLVADMPYLARGMRSISIGMDAGSGSEKWFGGKKKRRKSKKK